MACRARRPKRARTTTAAIELGATLQPKFGPDGLIPCITQDVHTGEVLMFAFMNAESLSHTLTTKKATYWSRSRNKLWVKGEESGNVQHLREVRTDCDQDVLLLKVEQRGADLCRTVHVEHYGLAVHPFQLQRHRPRRARALGRHVVLPRRSAAGEVDARQLVAPSRGITHEIEKVGGVHR